MMVINCQSVIDGSNHHYKFTDVLIYQISQAGGDSKYEDKLLADGHY